MVASVDTILEHFTLMDGLALGLHLLLWAAITWIVEHETFRRPSAYILMLRYRRDWMTSFLTRDPRVYDAVMLSSLKQSATFLASTCLIAVGGGAAMIGQADRLGDLAATFTEGQAAPALVWQLKLLIVLLFVANALLKFIWAVRVYGYQAVVMSAIPNDGPTEASLAQAARAAELNIYGSRSFNRGLRAIYFSLAALPWLIGPLAFILATLVTALMVVRREYFSASRNALVVDG